MKIEKGLAAFPDENRLAFPLDSRRQRGPSGAEIVDHFVIVPLYVDGHFGEKTLEVRVGAVVTPMSEIKLTDGVGVGRFVFVKDDFSRYVPLVCCFERSWSTHVRPLAQESCHRYAHRR